MQAVSALNEIAYIDILKTPESLTAFMLDSSRDSLWIKHHQTYYQGLINRAQYWVETGKLDLTKALEIRRIFHEVFPEEAFCVYEGNETLKVSRLLLMEKSDWFRSYFLSGFKEKNASETRIEKFSCFISLKLFNKLYQFLKFEDINALQSLCEPDIFLLIKQCHLWGLFFVISQLEKQAKIHITNAVKALETLEGARLYQLQELEAHCLKNGQLQNGRYGRMDRNGQLQNGQPQNGRYGHGVCLVAQDRVHD